MEETAQGLECGERVWSSSELWRPSERIRLCVSTERM